MALTFGEGFFVFGSVTSGIVEIQDVET